jgi:transcription-repair coupling factor (superfamily II helicase)
MATGIQGSELSHALSQIIEQHEGLVLVVCESSNQASRLSFESNFFNDHRYSNHIFPDWETLPYDFFSPHEDIVSERLSVLAKLPSMQAGVLFVAANTLAQRVCPQSYVQGFGLHISKGDQLDIDEFRNSLQDTGYHAVQQVVTHAEYAIRGSIIDIFPMGSARPYRIDLFDNEVDSIRPFDAETQRSESAIETISLLPAHEYPLSKEGITTFRNQWRDQFAGDPLSCPIYADVSQGMSTAGLEYYLPLFFEHTASLLDYVPKNTLLVRVNDVQNKLLEFQAECEKRHEQYAHDITRPILEPKQLFFTSHEIFAQAKNFEQVKITGDFDTSNYQKLPELQIDGTAKNPCAKIMGFMAEHPDYRILFCCESKGRRESLLELLRPHKITPHTIETWQQALSSDKTALACIAPLLNGFMLKAEKLVVISENDLYGTQVVQYRGRKGKATSPEQVIRNLVELKINDPVVHEQHGVGRYLGLKTIEVDGIESEFLMLEYANNDKIYVPVTSLHLISRYSGIDDAHTPLNKLGTATWNNAKKKAMQQIRDTAAELLNIYARRSAKPGFACKTPDQQYLAFEKSFPFEETIDQQQAIDQVLKDMTTPSPMDRLICGDVGFGKTEVAMRASFIAVHSDKQVAVLVPTTLLAKQHFDSFSDRFVDYPVQIRQLSRFCSDKQNKETLQLLQDAKVDIVIGTHALLNKLVDFKDLGLVIIDEEHRFGVRQKEKLKALRTEVDILTLTATPIPRTLNMAMHGVRDLSIIATPPKRRLSIKTFVHENNDALIREAILREVLRGGQVYYLHNDVATIKNTADKLARLVPEARINIGHGQMREHDLERVMSDFYHQKFNVLVCTTIIETGIDIPTANTIIMDRADKLGMAQMHQLRGRVGRSHHQAYAYLLVPNKKLITKDAEKRLEAISSLEDLGAGFMLATHDLEIRGAGEILGQQQSGHIQSIGYSLYTELLERAVDALRSGREPDIESPVHQDTEIDLKMPALIPTSYIDDVHIRLIFYKRIANCKDNAELSELQVEMIDRFGLLPQPLKLLFRVAQLRRLAKAMGISKIDASSSGALIEFSAEPKISSKVLIDLIQNMPTIYKLRGQTKLSFHTELEDFDKRISSIEGLLLKLRITDE